MKKAELAEKIFRDIYQTTKPEKFGYREENGAFVWASDNFDWKIVVCSKNSALLYATLKNGRGYSMIRRYFYNGSRLDNERVVV